MSDDSLQSFQKSSYERPNQPWECGSACEGVRCALGPTVRGGCQADYECAPADKNGKWICNRSKAQGGKCSEGPEGHVCSHAIPTCSPVASIRRRRGTFVLWCCTATLGLTLVTLGASWRDDVIKPGELSSKHAQIIKNAENANANANANENRMRCVACHTAAEAGGLDEWAALAITGASEHASQSERCLACHREKIGDVNTAVFPHGLSPDVMAKRTQSVCERLGMESPRTVGVVGMQNGQVACSACHREHQGAWHDLTATANGKCAGCHQDSFRDFASSHPEFGDWPYRRRTRIAFDHAMHQGRYFPESKKEFACRACHESAGRGIVSTVSYENACQSCHDDKIQQSFGEGVPLIALPMLDLRAFKAEGLSVGEWPEMANGDFDGAMPPLMRVLLSSDPLVRSSLEQFGKDFEFADVDPENFDDLEAARDIGRGIKKLVHELTTSGPQAMRERLQTALGRTLTDEELRDLLARLPSESTERLQQAWFPNLEKEIAALNVNQSLPVIDKGVVIPSSVANTAEAFGWQRDDETLTFGFRPRGHAPAFMTTWLNVVTSSPRLKTSDDVQAAFQQLTSQTSAGLCVTCHSVDANVDGGFVVHWHGQSDETGAKGFTRFSHDPHLILPQLRDCTACHEVNNEVTTSADYLQSDPMTFQRGFHPMTKQACASCHAPKLAGDQCTKCHTYHVGMPSFGRGDLSQAIRPPTVEGEE